MRNQVTVTIASGAAASSVFRAVDYALFGVIMPAAFTGTALAVYGCNTATGTFVPVYDSDGNAISITVSTSMAAGLSGAEADACAAFPFLKFVSNAAGPGYEAGARSIVVCMK